MILNLENIREELTHDLRNGDVLSINVRGVTTDDEQFDAIAGQTEYETDNNPIRNIRELTINGDLKRFIRDFTFDNTKIIFNTPLSLNDDVEFTYDFGGNEKIYPDYPRDDLKLTSFPRIAMNITSGTTEPLSLGGATHITDLIITIFVLMPVNKDANISEGLGGTDDLSNVLNLVRSRIISQAKQFVTFSYIHPIGISPITKSTNNKIIQQSQDFKLRFVVEE